MIKEREHVLNRLNQAAQTLLTVASFTLACAVIHWTQWQELLPSKEFNSYVLLTALIGWIAVEYSGLHQMKREDHLLDLFFRYVKIMVMATGLLFLAGLWLKTEWLSLPLLLLFGAICTGLLFVFKATFFSLMRFARRKGFNTRQLLVVADGNSADLIDDLIQTRDWGYSIAAVVSDSHRLKKRFGNELNLLPASTNLEELLAEEVIDELFYTKSILDYEEINRMMALCSYWGVCFRLRPAYFERHGLKPNFSFFKSSPTIAFRNIPDNYLALKMKRGMDILGALFAVLIFSPIYLFLALAIKLDDGGPVFFRQERVGLQGRRFYCLKFRTMVVNAEALKAALMAQNEQDGPVFKMKADPRITRIGKYLRRYSLDELPQFFNVLGGEMSIVGPRPPLPSEVQQYRNEQNRRLSVKPGITCIWQVSGRNNIDFDGWVALDKQYIDNWSLKEDVMIILKTVGVMFRGTGM